MSESLKESLAYINSKCDLFETRLLDSKKDDNREFLIESVKFYRIEAAAIRSEMFQTKRPSVLDKIKETLSPSHVEAAIKGASVGTSKEAKMPEKGPYKEMHAAAAVESEPMSAADEAAKAPSVSLGKKQPKGYSDADDGLV
jgi:hypothetical protein